MSMLRAHLVPVTVLLTVATASGKEKHFEYLRVLLIANSAKCISCHSDATGKKLNDYGKRLSALSKDEPLAERIAQTEADPAVDASESERKQILDGHDVDHDGVANWIEILAGSNPGDSTQKPDPKLAKRIETVISCNLCHVSTHGPGEGLAANPHNAFGKVMASTYVVPPRGRKPVGTEAVREAAERTPILTRLFQARTKKPQGSKATWWEKIELFHAPADAGDEPTSRELADLRKAIAKDRQPKARRPERGLKCDAHKPDGFLEDARGLVR